MQPSTLSRGALLLTAAMGCFSPSDVLAKQLSAVLPPVVLAWCRYLLLLLTVLPIAMLRPATFRTRRAGWQAARAAGLVGSAVLFLMALRALPIAEATAMVFASPLFVTLLAALVLHERVPLRRWARMATSHSSTCGRVLLLHPGQVKSLEFGVHFERLFGKGSASGRRQASRRSGQVTYPEGAVHRLVLWAGDLSISDA